MAEHDWVQSTLGHGDTMCSRCLITNREAAVLGITNICDIAPTEQDIGDDESEDGHAQGSPEPSAELVRLVIAARVVAFQDQSPGALRELDEASEAFAGIIPWEDEPADLRSPVEKIKLPAKSGDGE